MARNDCGESVDFEAASFVGEGFGWVNGMRHKALKAAPTFKTVEEARASRKAQDATD